MEEKRQEELKQLSAIIDALLALPKEDRARIIRTVKAFFDFE